MYIALIHPHHGRRRTAVARSKRNPAGASKAFMKLMTDEGSFRSRRVVSHAEADGRRGPVFLSGRYQVNPLVKETSASLAWPLVLGW
jgi:hypothetical protein